MTITKDNSLSFLITFFNLDFDSLDGLLAERETSGFTAKQIRERRLAGIRGLRRNTALIQFLERYDLLEREKRKRAERLRTELVKNLTDITTGEDESRKGYPVTLGYLSRLLSRINSFASDATLVAAAHRSHVTFQTEEAKSEYRDAYSDKRGIRIKINGKNFLIYEQFQDPRSFEEYLHLVIRRLLLQDQFWKLARCKSCGVFFKRRLTRQTFCRGGCRDNYHNELRLKSDYFNRYRDQIRKNKLKRARQLLKDGRPVEDVMSKTGLSLRILLGDRDIARRLNQISS